MNDYKVIPGGVAEVYLTQGKIALIDVRDLDLVLRFTWHASLSGTRWYAKTDAGGKTFYMHNVVSGRKEVDHANHDTLDNRRENLRKATRSLNLGNQRRRTDNTSGYKGVSKQKKKWLAYISKDGVRHRIGLFDTPEEAALAYNQAALKLYGEFACINEVNTQ